MTSLKPCLAAALALLSLGLAHAIPVTWELGAEEVKWKFGNFEYAKTHECSGVWAPQKPNGSYDVALDETAEMEGNLPMDTTVKLDSVHIVVDASTNNQTGPEEGNQPFPTLCIKHDSTVVAYSDRTVRNNFQLVYTAESTIEYSNSWLFIFDEDVFLETGTSYQIEFVVQNNNGEYTPYEQWEGKGIWCRKESDLDMTPFMTWSGTYTPRAVPEPTVLALLALGGVAVLLRRPKP